MVTSTWQCSFCLEGSKLWCLHVWNCGSGTGLGPGDRQLGRWSSWLTQGSFGSRRCLQVPWAWWLFVVFQWSNLVLHLMMLEAACALLEVLSISECYFQCLCFNTGLQVGREEWFYSLTNLFVWMSPQRKPRVVAGVSWSSFRLLPAMRSLFLLGHEVAGQVLLLVKPKSKLRSVRNLFWFPNLWVQAIGEFVHSVLWVFLLPFWKQRWYFFFSGSGGDPAPEVVWLVDFPCSLKKSSWHFLENIFPVLKILMYAFMLVSFTVLQRHVWTGIEKPISVVASFSPKLSLDSVVSKGEAVVFYGCIKRG